VETATATTACSVLKIEKKEMLRALREEHKFSDLFVAYLVQRHDIAQADLVDQLFKRKTAGAALLLPALGGQFKSGQLGSFQNRPTEVARNC
jgi:CRP/FNR family transcriptional regulator, cyclic AMP receptor protein